MYGGRHCAILAGGEIQGQLKCSCTYWEVHIESFIWITPATELWLVEILFGYFWTREDFRELV